MIYCVEDDEGIRELTVYTLNNTGLAAEGFEDGESMFAALGEKLPSLILLDIMLPGDDGMTILRKLKASNVTRNIPVIMLTAKSGEFDKVSGLDGGADDYITKPFGIMEMVSRVKAVLRRSQPDGGRILSAGAIEMDEVRRTVKVHGAEVILTLKEFELLRCMMRKPGFVFDRDTLLNTVWGYEYIGETRTVDVHVRTLRQKLGDQADMIETVRGIGYRISR